LEFHAEVHVLSRVQVDRRVFMQGVVAGTGLLCLGDPSLAAARPALTATDVDGAGFVVDGAGANVYVLPGPQGALMVDSGGADQAAALQRLVVARTGGKPVRLLINTHWHLNHTGGNERLRKAGAEILAHENTRLWMGTDIVSRWNGASFPPRPPAAWPTRTFYQAESLDFGDEVVECGYLLQAHTDGDIYVRLRKANVLVTGGVFTPGRYPVTDPATLGWIGGVTTATEQLLKLTDARTRIVPGLGAVQQRGALEAQLKMLTTVRDRLYALLRDGRAVDEMIEARPTAEFDAEWGDPTNFIRSAFVGMAAHVRQVPGIV
jgi:glyoxylase-like metal-dependent hydrolase (beta-lactamase superfamily II)